MDYIVMHFIKLTCKYYEKIFEIIIKDMNINQNKKFNKFLCIFPYLMSKVYSY